MTQLEKFLEDKRISYYKATQLLGKNAATSSANIAAKIRGELAFKMEEYALLCTKLSEFLHQDIKPEHFDYDSETIRTR